MDSGEVLTFGAFRLAGPHGPLWQGDTSVALAPKALAVLWTLVTHAGQVVTKDTLLDAVWGATIVSEGALAVHLRHVRQALGDSASTPQYIETVHRIGYRFIAKVVSSGAPPGVRSPASAGENSQSAILNPQSAMTLVGREAELAQLHSLFAQALTGERQIVFVTGEAGIGKTSLIDAFLTEARGPRSGVTESLASRVQSREEENQKSKACPELRRRGTNQKAKITEPRPATPDPWITRGQCIEHYGAGEAYLPVLEAVGRLCRQPEGDRVLRVLRQYAPSWLLQLPAVLSEAEQVTLHQKLAATTRERMLREMVEALEAVSAERPLVLVLEDVHWSDVSTIDLLSMLVRRRETARILVLATSRQAELIVSNHPLKTLKQELVTRGQATEILLGSLQAAAVQQYVGQRFAGREEEPELAAWVYRRTEGHPLFMVQMTDYLAQHPERRPAGPTALVALEQELPQGLRELIEAQVGRLTAEEQGVLEAGSAAGTEFTVASVAAALETSAGEVETRCEHLARRGQFIAEREVSRWPDGTLSGRYGFRHALYQEVLYQRLSASRRVRLHRLIGEREEGGYGEGASEIAAALAVHFERGLDYPRGIRYRHQADQRAIRQHAPREALAHVTHGLRFLPYVPDGPARAQLELVLQTARGVALVSTQGFGTPEVEQAYARAYELCRDTADLPVLFPVLYGLWNFFTVRADLRRASELAAQMSALAQRQPGPTWLVQVHTAQGYTYSLLGALAAARAELEQGLALYDAGQHRPLLAHYGEDPGVVCHNVAAQICWLLGFPDQARCHLEEGRRLAWALGHPFSRAQTLWHGAVVLQCCGDVGRAADQAQELIGVSREEAFPQWLVCGILMQGWARAHQGQGEAGVALIRQGLHGWRATGVEAYRPCHLASLAEAYGSAGQPDQGLCALTEALAIVDATGERWWEAELYRLKGELTIQKFRVSSFKFQVKNRSKSEVHSPQSKPPSTQHPTPNPQAEVEAEACFLKAIEIARRQQAKSFELRATMSLARLWHRQGKPHAARTMLAEVYNWFTEGFDTQDWQEAKVLLDALS